ncbi:hypothetical protein HY256_12455, partial [Candidatus Sumerlaeota bacterium]|nr:hypothetical protein [Candidatus Sumerlaeota bacterium]
MYLRLPEGYSPPNQSVQLAVRVTQAKEGQAWFGIRAMSDASAFPPAP